MAEEDLSGAKSAAPFASETLSVNQFYDRIVAIPGMTEERADELALQQFGRNPRALKSFGVSHDDPLPPFGGGRGDLKEVPVSPQPQEPGMFTGAGEVLADIADVPVAIGGGVAGASWRAARMLGADLPTAQVTGAMGMMDPTIPISLTSRVENLDTWKALRAHGQQYDRFRQKIAGMLREAGTAEEVIAKIMQDDAEYLRDAKASAPSHLVTSGFLPPERLESEIALERTPLFFRVNKALNGGLADALGPEEISNSRRILSEINKLKQEEFVSSFQDDPIFRQVQELEQSVATLSKEDRDMISALAADFKEVGVGTYHLLGEALGVTELREEYREQAGTGVLGRFGARWNQAWATGSDLAAGFVAAPAAIFQDPRIIREKPALAAMILLPFLKAGRGGLAGMAERAAMKDPAFAALREKVNIRGQGPQVGRMVTPELEQAGIKPSRRTGPAGERPYTIGDAVADTAGGMVGGVMFGTPGLGAAYGLGVKGLGKSYLFSRKRSKYAQMQVPAQEKAKSGTAGGIVESVTPGILEFLKDAGDREGRLPIGAVGAVRRKGEVALGSEQFQGGETAPGVPTGPIEGRVVELPKDHTAGLAAGERIAVDPNTAGTLDKVRKRIDEDDVYKGPDPENLEGEEAPFIPLRLTPEGTVERTNAWLLSMRQVVRELVELRVAAANEQWRINDTATNRTLRNMEQRALAMDEGGEAYRLRVQGQDISMGAVKAALEMPDDIRNQSILAEIAHQENVSDAIIRRYRIREGELTGQAKAMDPDMGSTGARASGDAASETVRLSESKLTEAIIDKMINDRTDALSQGFALEVTPELQLIEVQGPKYQAAEILFGDNKGRGELAKKLNERGYDLTQMWDEINLDGTVTSDTNLGKFLTGELKPRGPEDAPLLPPRELESGRLIHRERTGGEEFVGAEEMDVTDSGREAGTPYVKEFPFEGDRITGTKAGGQRGDLQSEAGADLGQYISERRRIGTENIERGRKGRSPDEIQEDIQRVDALEERLLGDMTDRSGRFRATRRGEKGTRDVPGGHEYGTVAEYEAVRDQMSRMRNSLLAELEVVGTEGEPFTEVRAVPRRDSPVVVTKGDSKARANYKEAVKSLPKDTEAPAFHEPWTPESHPRLATAIKDARPVDRLIDYKALETYDMRLMNDAEKAAMAEKVGSDVSHLFQTLVEDWIEYPPEFRELLDDVMIMEIKAPKDAKSTPGVPGTLDTPWRYENVTRSGPEGKPVKTSIRGSKDAEGNVERKHGIEPGYVFFSKKYKTLIPNIVNKWGKVEIGSYEKGYSPEFWGFEGKGAKSAIGGMPEMQQASLRFAKLLQDNPELIQEGYESVAFHRGRAGTKLSKKKAAEAEKRFLEEQKREPRWEAEKKERAERLTRRRALKEEIAERLPADPEAVSVLRGKKGRRLQKELDDLFTAEIGREAWLDENARMVDAYENFRETGKKSIEFPDKFVSTYKKIYSELGGITERKSAIFRQLEQARVRDLAKNQGDPYGPAVPSDIQLKLMREHRSMVAKAKGAAFAVPDEFMERWSKAFGLSFKKIKRKEETASKPYTWIGGDAIPGPRSLTLPKQSKIKIIEKKGKDGKTALYRKVKGKEVPLKGQDAKKYWDEKGRKWTVGDSIYQWTKWANSWRNLGNRAKLIDSKWAKTQTTLGSEGASVQLKTAIGDHLMASVKRGFEGDYTGAVKALGDLRLKVSRSILDQELAPSKKSAFKDKLSSREAQLDYTVKTKMAQVMPYADLIGLRDAISKLQLDIMNAAMEGRLETAAGPKIRRNRISKLSERLQEQKFYRTIIKAPYHVLDEFYSGVRRVVDQKGVSLEKMLRGAPTAEHSIIKIARKLSSDELFVLESLLAKRRKLSEYKPQVDVFRNAEQHRKKYEALPEGERHLYQKPLTEAQIKAEVREIARGSSFDHATSLARAAAEADEFLVSKTRKQSAWEGNPQAEVVEVGADGIRRSVMPEAASEIAVSKWLESHVVKTSKRIEKLTGIPAGSYQTAMGNIIKHVFDKGSGLLITPLLRGMVKELALKEVRKNASEAGILSGKVLDDLITQTSKAIDQSLSDFDRPFRVADIQNLELFQFKQPSVLEVSYGSGVKKSIDMSALFDQALKISERSSDAKHNLQGIQLQAAASIIDIVSSEVRQASLFKGLVEGWERAGVEMGHLEVFRENWEKLAKADTAEKVGALPEALADGLDRMGDSIIESVFGRFDTAPHGLPLTSGAARSLRLRLQGRPSELVKVVEGGRGRALTKKEISRLVGDEPQIVTPDSEIGRYLNWIDNYSTIGNIRKGRSWIADKMPIAGILPKFGKANESQAQMELNALQEIIFPEDSMFSPSRERAAYTQEVVVSPEWNDMQGYEIASRHDLSTLIKTFQMNDMQIRATAQAAHRFAKGSLTTLNPVTHIGNVTSNVVAVSMLTGETPFEVVARTASAAAAYVKHQKLKAAGDLAGLNKWKSKNKALGEIFDNLDELGFEMKGIVEQELSALGNMLDDPGIKRYVKDNIGDLGKDATPPGMIRKMIRWTGDLPVRGRKQAMKIYNIEDISFRISEFAREYTTIKSATERLAFAADRPGEINLRTGPHSITKIYKYGANDFRMYKSGKLSKVLEPELRSRLSRAAMRKVNKVIFDYADIPPFVRWLRDQPFSAFISPFITWAYKAIDVPGLKRGMIAETLFAEPAFTTNDPRLMVGEAFRTGRQEARRALLVGSLLSQRTAAEEIGGRMGRYLQEPLGLSASILQTTAVPGVTNALRTTNADPFQPSLMLLRNLAGTVGTMMVNAEDILPKKEGEKLNLRDKHLQLLRKSAMSGYLLNNRELRSLIHLGGSPAGQLMYTIVYGKPVGRQGEARAGDYVKPLAEMAVGPYIYKQLDSTINLMFNPGGKSSAINSLFPSRIRHLREERERSSLDTRGIKPFSIEDEIAEKYGWWIDGIMQLGQRRLNAPKRNAQLLTEMKTSMINDAIKPFRAKMEFATGKELQDLRDRKDQVARVVADTIEGRISLYSSISHRIGQEGARKVKAVQRAAIKSGRSNLYLEQ